MKHIVIRSEREQRMIQATKVAGGILACAALVLFVRELPNLVRYVRMETM